MDSHRSTLPQLSGRLFLTDGGIETDLIFHHRAELPYNAAYVLLQSEAGTDLLRRYFADYVAIAAEHRTGLVLESATWRANPDWAARIGTSPATLAEVNRRAIDMLAELRRRHGYELAPIVVSGCVGPRSDGYRPEAIMTVHEAKAYHSEQIRGFRDAGADLVTAITMTNVPEAVGIVRAASTAGLPVVVSFTLETDGCLPTGERLRDAVMAVDAATGDAPAYYMINCAHPTHFLPALEPGAVWTQRIRGVRANASCRSHVELDESPDLDEGDPLALAAQYRALRAALPRVNVLGGCCGTDHRHVRAIAAACAGGQSPLQTPHGGPSGS